jgi:hypothetical protein
VYFRIPEGFKYVTAVLYFLFCMSTEFTPLLERRFEAEGNHDQGGEKIIHLKLTKTHEKYILGSRHKGTQGGGKI